jgi:phage terminase large subunit-like protein
MARSTATKRRPSWKSPTPAAISPPPSGRFIDLGSVVADWIEANLVHGEGDFYGLPFLLDPFQRFLLRRLYLVDAETLHRIVRRALLIGPKGWGKTELLGGVGLAELAGPSSVTPTGRPTRRLSPNIPIAAASWEQTDRLFEAAFTMATHRASGVAPFLDAFETEIGVKGQPGRLFRVAAVGATNEGGLPTAFIADELHEWRLPRQRRVHLVIGNSLAKREQGLELNISTPDDAAPDSLLGNLVAYGERVAAGEINDPTFLYVRYSASNRWDLDKPKELRAAIREATPASWVDVERVAARYEIDRIPEHEFRRYHLGQFVRPQGSWLPAGSWEPLEADVAVAEQAPIVLGFDGSYNRDSTGLIGCTLEGHLFVLGHWERPDGAPDSWRVPRAEVDAAVDHAFTTYKVREMACDPFRWTSEIEAWEERYGETVVEFPTNSPSRMSPACARFYAAVVSAQGMSHSGDPALSRHLYNAVVKEHRDGAYITKENRDSPRRIDLAVAAVMAFDRAMWHAGQRRRPEPSFAWA